MVNIIYTTCCRLPEVIVLSQGVGGGGVRVDVEGPQVLGGGMAGEKYAMGGLIFSVASH